MSEYKVLLLWVVCLCCEVVMTDGEVVWVNRNVTDSFRVGKDGCTSDENVCTSVSATCQPDGSCLCKTGSPTFRNPVIERSSGTLIYGSTYGCIDNRFIVLGVGKCMMFDKYNLHHNHLNKRFVCSILVVTQIMCPRSHSVNILLKVVIFRMISIKLVRQTVLPV
jgi:hypothetical protein